MERTPNFIKVWFWSRQDGSVPSDVKNGHTSLDTDNWVRTRRTVDAESMYQLVSLTQGTPFAFFPSTDCDLDSHFGWHNIVINLTLCMYHLGLTVPYTDTHSRRRLGWCNF